MSETPSRVRVQDLLQFRADRHRLQALSPGKTLTTPIQSSQVVRPGLALLGYPETIPEGAVWLLGTAEVQLLQHPPENLPLAERIAALRPAALILPDSQTVPTPLADALTRRGIALLTSPLSLHDLYYQVADALAYLLAPVQVLHGTLVDVYGVGILITGPSGIGKSECALGLVQRGHVLVGDDLIRLRPYPRGQLLGMSAADDPLQRRYLEIRGVGLLDLALLFGVHATRESKRVEVHVAFVSYDQGRNLDRLGLEVKHREFLGVALPHYTLPVIPGKNLAAILEALALRYHLRQQGYFMAREFEHRLTDRLKAQGSSHEDS